MAKKVLATKFQELKGLDRISTIVHEMRCLFREISKDDVGIDGEIEMLVRSADDRTYEATGGILKVQSKSGESYVRQDSATGFITPVEKADLEYWYNSNFPTLFIVYHPKDDKLYWKEVKGYVRSAPDVWQPPFRVEFDKSVDEFAVSSYESLLALAEVSPPRISFEQRERLYSNLLPVTRLPRKVYRAPTPFNHIDEIYQRSPSSLPPSFLKNGILYSLADLQSELCVLGNFCEYEKTEQLNASRWIEDAANFRDFVFLLNQFFGKHLRRCGLAYNKFYKRNYFPCPTDDRKEVERTWYNIRTGRSGIPRTVAKYYQYGHDRFWRHLAANISFKRIGSSWFLQIIPKYFFTVDGLLPWDNEKVGPYTTRLKAVERNIHVLNHVLFWADFLAQEKPCIRVSLDGVKLLEIGTTPISTVVPFAIPNDPSVYEEPEDSGQRDFLDALWENLDEDEIDGREFDECEVANDD